VAAAVLRERLRATGHREAPQGRRDRDDVKVTRRDVETGDSPQTPRADPADTQDHESCLTDPTVSSAANATNESGAKRRSQAELGCCVGPHPEFTERLRGGSQRSVAGLE
jgi:hypothetical protein